MGLGLCMFKKEEEKREDIRRMLLQTINNILM